MCVDYLDIRVKSVNRDLVFSVYDKRDNFNFEVVNFPHMDSCIPRRPALGVFYAQLIRIARICMKYGDFCERIRMISERLLGQGYKYRELSILASSFFRDKNDLTGKFGERNIISFANRVIFKQ